MQCVSAETSMDEASEESLASHPAHRQADPTADRTSNYYVPVASPPAPRTPAASSISTSVPPSAHWAHVAAPPASS